MRTLTRIPAFLGTGIILLVVLIVVLSGCETIHYPVLDETRCIGCGDCLAVCSYDAIHFEDGKPVIDVNKCTGCGECAQVCPTEALVMP